MQFIVRGIVLGGICRFNWPKGDSSGAWSRLAQDLDLTNLEAKMTEKPLNGAVATAQEKIHGRARGRFVVNVNA